MVQKEKGALQGRLIQAIVPAYLWESRFLRGLVLSRPLEHKTPLWGPPCVADSGDVGAWRSLSSPKPCFPDLTPTGQ